MTSAHMQVVSLSVKGPVGFAPREAMNNARFAGCTG